MRSFGLFVMPDPMQARAAAPGPVRRRAGPYGVKEVHGFVRVIALSRSQRGFPQGL